MFTKFLSRGNYCLFYFWSTLEENYNSFSYFTYIFHAIIFFAKYK